LTRWNIASVITANIKDMASTSETSPDRTTSRLHDEIRALAARRKAVILAHNYERPEVQDVADYVGDSLGLSREAAKTDAGVIVFCGVHFMAESADVLARDGQQVILPDLHAGCSMADMAEIGQVETCWETLLRAGMGGEDVLPLTYMNSTAAIKAFCGERGGLVCTSSNARAAFEWAFARAKKILFLPDQHLGRNTGHAMGIPLNEMVVYDPWQLNGGLTREQMQAARVILWKGQVIVHPECRLEVCAKADALGSTERLIKIVEDAPAGTSFAIGTEIHLVHRLAQQFAPQGKTILSLDETGCLCTTMYRISPQHLAWALENLMEGRVVNRIQVRDDVKRWARVALDRMLEIPA
jgi:quinolinate synthase